MTMVGWGQCKAALEHMGVGVRSKGAWGLKFLSVRSAGYMVGEAA